MGNVCQNFICIVVGSRVFVMYYTVNASGIIESVLGYVHKYIFVEGGGSWGKRKAKIMCAFRTEKSTN